MIQRIQTIFLILSAIALGFLLFSPLVSSTIATSEGFYQDGQLYTCENQAATITFGIGILLSIVAIFLFKNRKLQKNIVLLTILMILVGNLLGGLAFLEPTQSIMATNQKGITPGLGAFMPIVGLISLILAYRGINKDEKIVKSMDRLR